MHARAPWASADRRGSADGATPRSAAHSPRRGPVVVPNRAPNQKALLVFNPRAGGGRALAVATELGLALEQRGFRIQRAATIAPPKDARAGESVRLGLQASQAGGLGTYDLVLLVGGDGTLHEFLNAVAAFPCPVAFVGVGTVNVLSRELGLPRPDVDSDWLARTLALLEAGVTQLVPIAIARAGQETRRFLMFAEVGLLGGVVVKVNRWRREHDRHGKLEFVRYGAA